MNKIDGVDGKNHGTNGSIEMPTIIPQRNQSKENQKNNQPLGHPDVKDDYEIDIPKSNPNSQQTFEDTKEGDDNYMEDNYFEVNYMDDYGSDGDGEIEGTTSHFIIQGSDVRLLIAPKFEDPIKEILEDIEELQERLRELKREVKNWEEENIFQEKIEHVKNQIEDFKHEAEYLNQIVSKFLKKEKEEGLQDQNIEANKGTKELEEEIAQLKLKVNDLEKIIKKQEEEIQELKESKQNAMNLADKAEISDKYLHQKFVELENNFIQMKKNYDLDREMFKLKEKEWEEKLMVLSVRHGEEIAKLRRESEGYKKGMEDPVLGKDTMFREVSRNSKQRKSDSLKAEIPSFPKTEEEAQAHIEKLYLGEVAFALEKFLSFSLLKEEYNNLTVYQLKQLLNDDETPWEYTNVTREEFKSKLNCTKLKEPEFLNKLAQVVAELKDIRAGVAHPHLKKGVFVKIEVLKALAKKYLKKTDFGVITQLIDTMKDKFDIKSGLPYIKFS